MYAVDLILDGEIQWTQEVAGLAPVNPEIGPISAESWIRRLTQSAIDDGAIAEVDLPKAVFRVRC